MIFPNKIMLSIEHKPIFEGKRLKYKAFMVSFGYNGNWLAKETFIDPKFLIEWIIRVCKENRIPPVLLEEILCNTKTKYVL
ncbi:MAG: hypothetical protein E6R04_11615 [Spirochaetes bacterium]|nr:MAG: hypothetical protein E6R04_11615 [Spirochaetota bacterium]